MLTPTDTTSAVRLCAIAGAVKDTLATQAKRALPPGTSHAVDIAVRIRGTVTKGADKPASSGTAAPVVSLLQPAVMLDLLRRLKVTPQQVRTALRAAVKSIERPGDLSQLGQGVLAQDIAAAVESVQAELCARLPHEPWSNPGRAGSVHTDITIEVLPPMRAAAA